MVTLPGVSVPPNTSYALLFISYSAYPLLSAGQGEGAVNVHVPVSTQNSPAGTSLHISGLSHNVPPFQSRLAFGPVTACILTFICDNSEG
ncbi:hypothetical protein ES705_49941 [subsurface metagenome]